MTRREPALAPPGFLRNKVVWTLLMVLFLFPFFIHIPRSLNHHPIISPLGDQVHIFLFGAIALLLYWFGPMQGRIWRAAMLSAFMGGAVEFLQLLVGRQALFTDFLLDLLGIGIVVGFVSWKGHGSRLAKWVFLLLVLTLPAQLYHMPWRIAATYHCRGIFPVIADFETYSDRFLWGNNMEGQLSFPRIEDSPDGDGHVLRLSGDSESNWPGALMRRFPEDWSEYSVLKLDVRMVEVPGDSVRFGIRIDDYEGIKELAWISKSFYATRQWQTFSIPLVDRKLANSDRILNLAEMDRLIIYFGKPQEMRTIEIDNLRLEKD